METRDDTEVAGWRLSRLTSEQCRRLHNASLEILDRTGVRFYEPEAVELVRKAGAGVSDGNLVRIPARLVERALSTAPKGVILYDRNGRPVMTLEDHHAYYGPGCDCLNIIDHRTGERRRAVLRDVVEGVTLCDALEHVDFVMSMFLPGDVNAEIADRYQMEVMLNHTTKPILSVSYETSGCIDIVEMAETVVGGAATLASKPFLVIHINTTTALRHNKEALQKLLYLAGKGLPATYVPGTCGGLSAPVTRAGRMALKNAGTLAGVVVSQLKRPGTPVIVPGTGGTALDMRTLVSPYVKPSSQGAGEALARYYGLPMLTTAGVTDAKTVDQQAAIEAALTLLVEAQAGGHLVHDIGYMESGLCGSLVQLVICNEVIGWTRHLLEDIQVSDETLAVELIDEIGPDGQFLDSKHTLQHFRDAQWYPQLFERDNYDSWLAKGGKTLSQRAAERVAEILAEHITKALPKNVARAVGAVVERAATDEPSHRE